MATRVTRVSAAISGTPDTNVRVTRVSAAVSGTPAAAKTRIHRIAIQILANVPPDVQEATGSNSLVFSQTAASGTRTEDAASGLVFTNTVGVNFPQPKTSVNSLVFGQTGNSSLKTPAGSNSLVFGQNVTRRVLEKTSTSSLVFAQTPGKVHIKAGATDHTATHSLVFGQSARRTAEFSAVSGAVFSNTSSAEKVQEIVSELVFSQSATNLGTRLRTGTSSLVFSHQFLAEEGEISLCEWNPQLGGGTITTSLSRYGPYLRRASEITLSYPVVSPTNTVTLRLPEFGDRRRYSANRIFRESAGGTLEIFREDGWPEEETVSVQVIAIKESVAQDYLSLIIASLGKEIRYVDHEAREWSAIMTNTSDPLIRNHRNLVDINFDLLITGQL